jgi:hypothetical protein
MAGAQVAATVVRVVEVPDRETVDAFHAAAVEAASTPDGPGCDLTITPGTRPHSSSTPIAKTDL